MCVHDAGWLNVLGQFAATSGAGFLAAGLLDDIWGMVRQGDDLTRQETLLVYSSAQPACNFETSLSMLGCH